LEAQLIKNSTININKYLNILLNQDFSSLVCRLETDATLGSNQESLVFTPKRKSNLNEFEKECPEASAKKEKTSIEFESFETISKLFISSNLCEQEFATKIYDLNINWKHDTLKCVDATPLIVFKKSYEFPLVLIGSHSRQFICVNAVTGLLKWSFSAQDRIESSACLSKCGNYVIFGKYGNCFNKNDQELEHNFISNHLKGSYDKCLYVLRIKDGSLKWKFETMEPIKSSPFINQENGYLYFGSHDKMLYCLDIEVKFKFIAFFNCKLIKFILKGKITYMV
jgi:outer membrane protein assembly factor BamB